VERGQGPRWLRAGSQDSCAGLEFLFHCVESESDASWRAWADENRARSESNREVVAQHYNAVEVTGIVTKTFLGLPYSIISAHPRHVQKNCYLDNAEARRLLMSGQNFMLPSRILRQTSREKGASFPSVAD